MFKLFVSGSEKTFRLQFHLGGHFKRAGKNCYKTFYIRNLQMYVISQCLALAGFSTLVFVGKEGKSLPFQCSSWPYSQTLD
jgi:hypothetical protein